VPDTSFAARIGDLIVLTPDEHAALVRLGERQRRLRRNAILLSENDRLTELFVLKEGMMMSYVLLDDGRRQILRFIFPGDILATPALAYAKSPETLMALTDAVVCPFDRGTMAAMFATTPRLAAAIMARDQAERVAMTTGSLRSAAPPPRHAWRRCCWRSATACVPATGGSATASPPASRRRRSATRPG